MNPEAVFGILVAIVLGLALAEVVEAARDFVRGFYDEA